MITTAAGSTIAVPVSHFDALASTRRVLTYWPLAGAILYFVILNARPDTFAALLILDMWFLGYAHVAATFLRVFDLPLSSAQRRFVGVDLVLVSFALAALLSLRGTAIYLSSAYLYWQWFHYVRQGYGMTKLVDSRDRMVARSAYVLLYSASGAAFCAALSRSDGTFLGAAVMLPPSWLLEGLAVVSAIVAGAAGLVGIRLFRGVSSLGPQFLLSSLLVLCLSYSLLPLGFAWLVVNVWHNTQYLLVVRFWPPKAEAVPILTRRSDAALKEFALFLAMCLVIAWVLYGVFNSLLMSSPLAGGVWILSFYMAVNFHHYLVDALIWRRKVIVPASVLRVHRT